MKSHTPNHLERATLKPLAPVTRIIAVATILAAFITSSPAIMVHTLNGAAVEVRYFSGTVTHVDQRRRTFALKFQGSFHVLRIVSSTLSCRACAAFKNRLGSIASVPIESGPIPSDPISSIFRRRFKLPDNAQNITFCVSLVVD
jgi:hypothetical protein